MKRHVSEKAIKRVATEYQNAYNFQQTSYGHDREYWLGKKVAIADTFAYMTDVSFNEACDILESYYKKL